MITRAPRVYTDPMLLCPGRCIIIKTDCGAEAIGYALVLVDRPCVRMVTDLDILKDRSMSRRIATNVYKRDSTRKSWAACEGELEGHVRAVEKYAGFINTALLFYKDNQADQAL